MKSIRYTLLCAVMSASLVGCGGGSDNAGPDHPPVTKTNFSVSNKDISLSAPVKVSSAKLSKVLQLKDHGPAESSFDVMYNGVEPVDNAKDLTGVTTTHVPCSSVPNGYKHCVSYTVTFAPTQLQHDIKGEIDFTQTGTTEGLSSEKVVVNTSIPSWPVTTDSVVYDAPNSIVKSNLVYSYDNRISVKITLPNNFNGEEFNDWSQAPTLATSKGVKLTLATDLSPSEKPLSCIHNSYKNAAGKNACMLYFQTPSDDTAVGNQFTATPLTLTLGDAKTLVKTPITVNALAAKDFFVSTYAAKESKDNNINWVTNASMLQLQGPLGSPENDIWNAFKVFENPVQDATQTKEYNVSYIDSFFANPSDKGAYLGTGLGTYSTYENSNAITAANICNGSGVCNSKPFATKDLLPSLPGGALQFKASAISSNNKQKALLYYKDEVTPAGYTKKVHLYFPESATEGANEVYVNFTTSSTGEKPPTVDGTLKYNMVFDASSDASANSADISRAILLNVVSNTTNSIYYNDNPKTISSAYSFNLLSPSPKIPNVEPWMTLGNSLVAVDTDGSGLTIVTPQIGDDKTPKVTTVSFKTKLDTTAIANYSNISCTSDDLTTTNNRCFIYGSKPVVLSDGLPTASNGTASFVEFTGNLLDTKVGLVNSVNVKFTDPVKDYFYSDIKIDPTTGRVLSIQYKVYPFMDPYLVEDNLHYTNLIDFDDVTNVSSAGWNQKGIITKSGKFYSLDKIYLY